MVKKSLDKYLFNPTTFKVIMLVATLILAVPYMHHKASGYLKLVLLYGVLICLWQLMQKRFPLKTLKSPPAVFLVLFVVSNLVTVALLRGAGMYESISQLCYMAVFFSLFVILNFQREDDELKKEFVILSYVFTGITYLYSLFGFYSYLCGMYILYQMPPSTEYYRFGVSENRLWGLYNPNMGATLNSISILLSLFIIVRCVKGRKGKENRARYTVGLIFGILNIVLQYFCLVLTDSRTGNYALVIVLAIILAYVVYARFTNKGKSLAQRILVTFIALCVGAALFIVLGMVVEKGLSYLPSICRTVFGDDFMWKKTGWECYQLVMGSSNSVEINFDFTKLFSANVLEVAQGDLERKNTTLSFLSGREYLWEAALKVFKDYPIFGITYGNIQDFVIPMLGNCEGVNLVDQIKAGGLHNGYITVLLSSGFVGFALFLITIVYFLVKSLKRILDTKVINDYQFAALTVCVFLLITEMFEAQLLYRPGIPNVVFWIFAGYLIKFSETRRLES